MKLVVVLCLLNVGVALADCDALADRVDGLEAQVDKMQNSLETCLPTEFNGCGELCADVITISAKHFLEFLDGTCYVVDGTLATKWVTVNYNDKCAKITIASCSSLYGITAHPPRPFFAPRPAKR